MLVGYKPGPDDALPPFERQYPLLAAELGIGLDPERGNAQRLIAALEALRQDHR